MIKYFSLLAALCVFSFPASAEKITRGIESPNIEVELLLAPQVALSRAGVYRIDDHKTGYHIYVITTGQAGQRPTIEIAPIKSENKR